MSLKGLNAVIVGGGDGIGRGSALALAARGVNLLVADLRLPTAQAVAAQARAAGVQAEAMQVDVADPAQVEMLAARAYALFGAINLLVNSPGIVLWRPLEEASDSDWRKLMDVNFFGVVQCCRSFAPRMKAQEAGLAHIVNMGSMASLVAHPKTGIGLYTAAKHALLGYSECLRNELAGSGVGVSLMTPGEVLTGLSANSAAYLTGEAAPEGAQAQAMSAAAITAEQAGERLIEGVEQNRFLIVTHPERRAQVVARFEAELADFDAA